MDAEERKRLERDLNLAHELQMSLVPAVALAAGPWEVRGKVLPARQACSDYYAYFPLADGRFGVTIAQVWGKGLTAALQLSKSQAMLRAFCNGDREIGEAIRQVNRGLAMPAVGWKVIKLFYGEVDHEHGVLRFINAGHSFPMLRRRAGAIEELMEGGLPLGLDADAEHERGEVAFAPGDVLLLYSDGISHATDSRGDQFGEDRLRTILQSCCALPSGEIIDYLLRDVEAFRGGAEQSDDMTVVVVGPRTDR